MENAINMDDLGVPLFLETPICLGNLFRDKNPPVAGAPKGSDCKGNPIPQNELIIQVKDLQ